MDLCSARWRNDYQRAGHSDDWEQLERQGNFLTDYLWVKTAGTPLRDHRSCHSGANQNAIMQQQQGRKMPIGEQTAKRQRDQQPNSATFTQCATDKMKIQDTGGDRQPERIGWTCFDQQMNELSKVRAFPIPQRSKLSALPTAIKGVQDKGTF